MSHLNCKLIFLTVLIGICSVLANFPDDPKPCKYEESACITKLINYFLHEKKNGDSSLNFPRIDPLKITKVNIRQGSDSPIAIDLIFTNGHISGLSNSHAINVKGFGKDPVGKHVVNLKLNAQLISNYKIDGKVLILPIKGEGKSNFTIINGDVTMHITGTTYEKNGAKYFKAVNTILKTTPERITFNFENLFNGDKALGDNMNLFLNENWEEVFNELKKPIQDEFAIIFEGVINQIFSHAPYESFFLKD